MARAHFRMVPYRLLPYIDWQLIVLTVALVVAGIVTLWGATIGGLGGVTMGIPGYAFRQMVFAAIGLTAMTGLIFIDYRKLRPWSWLLYGVLMAALVGLVIRGVTIKGAAAWYDLGFFNLQPSEPGKLVLILVLAHYLSQRMHRFRGLFDTIVPLAIVGAPLATIVWQRDLGTAMVYVPLAGSMFWVAGLRKRVFFLFLVLGLAGGVYGFQHLKPYQKERIQTFLNPEADLRGSGWNIFQAKTTLGSGELTGKGWGQGTQTQFSFLPEFHTDFIFPTVGEQFGFVGCMVVIFLFVAFVWRLVALARSTPDLYGTLILTGFAATLVTHIVQNIGMVIGLLPITGLPLPFFSYGGSFMLTTLGGVGLALSIAARRGLVAPEEEEE